MSSDDPQSSTTSSVLVMSSKAFMSGWRKSIHIQLPRLNTSAGSRAFKHCSFHTGKTFHKFQPLLPNVVSGMLRRFGPVYFVYRRVVVSPSADISFTSHVPLISDAAVMMGAPLCFQSISTRWRFASSRKFPGLMSMW